MVKTPGMSLQGVEAIYAAAGDSRYNYYKTPPKLSNNNNNKKLLQPQQQQQQTFTTK
jgi:hypothetical protein